MSRGTLTARAERWLAADPDPTTRAELRALLERRDTAALAERFDRTLGFGTAGVRGLRGAGPGRMNRLLVRLLTLACARVLLQRVTGAAERGVVIGHDARPLASEMAQDTCAVLNGLGIRTQRFAAPRPTPLIGFAVLERRAAAGVVLTASHNPPGYNGYKLFWDDGVLVVPPVDAEIERLLAGIDPATTLPWLEPEAAYARGLLVKLDDAVEAAYLRAIRPAGPAAATDPGIVYTPLHGVAGSLARRALEQQGFAVSVVAGQFRPDGRFPTVAVPNPEDPAALERALDRARREQAALVLANDPDGDRLAVAARTAGGDYRVLSGDQIGWLLCDYILASGGELSEQAFVLTTIVSSQLLQHLAAAYGVRCEQTLTGIKWIWHRALELEARGGRFLFGYEESLGYSVCPRVRDKDGISAALLFAELAGDCAAQGRTVFDRLAELYRRIGCAATRQISLPLPGAAGTARGRAILDRLRREPPQELDGRAVVALVDLQSGWRIEPIGGSRTPIALPASNVVQIELAGGDRVSLRPSGTEPKLKVYLESYRPLGSDPAELERSATAALGPLEAALGRWLGQPDSAADSAS